MLGLAGLDCAVAWTGSKVRTQSASVLIDVSVCCVRACLGLVRTGCNSSCVCARHSGGGGAPASADAVVFRLQYCSCKRDCWHATEVGITGSVGSAPPHYSTLSVPRIFLARVVANRIKPEEDFRYARHRGSSCRPYAVQVLDQGCAASVGGGDAQHRGRPGGGLSAAQGELGRDRGAAPRGHRKQATARSCNWWSDPRCRCSSWCEHHSSRPSQ